MEECLISYGPIFTARLGGFERIGASNVVFVAEPDALHKLFTGGREYSYVGESRASIEPIVGRNSLLLLDDDEHLRHRRYISPQLHGERLTRFAEVIAEITDAEVDHWPTGRGFQLLAPMQRITLEVILKVVFGLDQASRAAVRRRVQRLLGKVANVRSELVMALPPKVGPWDTRAGFERARAAVDKTIFAEAAERRRDRHLEMRDDVLSLLLLARDEAGAGMTDSEIADELVTLLLAGHESTAVALSWTFERLLRSPDKLARLVTESRAETEGPMPYLDAVVKEILRLRPPFPIATRSLRTSVPLGGYELPAGTAVVPAIYLLHRRPDLYPEPEVFRPERFLEHDPERYAYIPFGGGPRRCVGGALAEFEMKVVLRTVLRRTELKAVKLRPEKPRRRAIVLAPHRGARVELIDRYPRAPLKPSRDPTPTAAAHN